MERTVAKCLLEIEAIFFGFTKGYVSSSGHKMPLYCDNRLILSYPRVRRTLAKWMGKIIKEQFPDVEMIIGTAVNGISFAVLLSENLNLPMGYVQEKKKTHGRENRIEGAYKPHTKVVVVDDVVFTGNTTLDVVECLQDNNIEVLGVLSIFSYQLAQTIQRLESANIKHISLTNYDVVCLIGMQTGLITYDEYLKSKKFLENPFTDEWLK